MITSPPYPGLIDYHEQHRYAYELLGLDDRRERELGAAARGHGQGRDRGVRAGIAAVLARSKAALRRGAPVCIVVNDRRGLYPEILERAGYAWTSGSSGTSTGGRAAARASTSSRS